MIYGQVSAFVDVLGASRNDERYERLLDAIGGETVVETYVDDGVVSRYESIPERGLSFLFADDQLDTVFIYAAGKAEMAAYREEAVLIEGMSLEWKRTAVERALGTPVRATSNYLTYRCERGYVQVDFDGEDIVMVVVMAELAGGDDSGNQESAPSVIRTENDLTGEIEPLMRAVGTPLFSPEHQQIIVNAGPQMESFEDDRNGVHWLYFRFPLSGVILQVEEHVLVAVLIELDGDRTDAVYPALDRLIAGVPLPALRSTVTAHFGSPRTRTSSMDLFFAGNHYLRFDYNGDRTESLTIIQPGVELEKSHLFRGMFRDELENRLKAVNRKAVEFGFDPTTFTVGKS